MIAHDRDQPANKNNEPGLVHDVKVFLFYNYDPFSIKNVDVILVINILLLNLSIASLRTFFCPCMLVLQKETTDKMGKSLIHSH